MFVQIFSHPGLEHLCFHSYLAHVRTSEVTQLSFKCLSKKKNIRTQHKTQLYHYCYFYYYYYDYYCYDYCYYYNYDSYYYSYFFYYY